MGGDIFATERVVDLEEHELPAGARLNLNDQLQEITRDCLLECLVIPGAFAEEIGQRELVGVRQARQSGQVSQRLVFAGADQQCLDKIERVPLLSRRKCEQQRQQEVAQ